MAPDNSEQLNEIAAVAAADVNVFPDANEQNENSAGASDGANGHGLIDAHGQEAINQLQMVHLNDEDDSDRDDSDGDDSHGDNSDDDDSDGDRSVDGLQDSGVNEKNVNGAAGGGEPRCGNNQQAHYQMTTTIIQHVHKVMMTN